MPYAPARVGDLIHDIDTPALILDLDAFERNISKMAEFTRSAGVSLRPHTKTHRCPTIAHKQSGHGAVGQCCQKVGEAEVLVYAGIKDVLVSNQVVGSRKLRRLAALAKYASISLCFDDAEQVKLAGQAAREFGVELGALVEIDLGMQRCGVAPGEAAADLAATIAAELGLKFMGLQAYQGRAQHLKSYAERKAAIETAAQSTRLSIDAIAAKGLACQIVGGGGTGTYAFEGKSRLWTELQCGSYIFMDGEYSAISGHDGEPYADFEQSLFVLASVMSIAGDGRAVVDAGLKSYSMEKGLPGIFEQINAKVVSVSDEHGTLALEKGSRLSLGTKLKLVPSHCDPTVNLHDTFVCVRKNRVEALWPIAARGAST